MWLRCLWAFKWFGFLLGLVGLSSRLVADEHRAKELFKLCQTCHGAHGEGNQKIEAPSIAGLPAWYIEAQLTKFANGARGGHPKDIVGLRMRPMARTLKTAEDLKDITAYVSNLNRPHPGPQTVQGKWLKGETAYQVCVPCHGQKAEGNQALGAPPLAKQDDWYVIAQLKKFKAKLRGYDAANDAFGASMAGIAAGVDEKVMPDLAAYIYGIGASEAGRN